MSKYYKVFLEYEDLCVICKKIPFTKDLYKEIITDKIIYPSSIKNENKLTYGYLQNGIPRCYEIKNSEAKEWLCQLNATEYIYELERIEDILAKSHKVEIDEKKVYKGMEKEAGKSIKKSLRKIKQR